MSDFQFQLNVDIHGEGDREVEVSMPKWYSFSSINLLSDTLVGSMAYTIKFVGKSAFLFCFRRYLNITSGVCFMPIWWAYQLFVSFPFSRK